MIRIFKFILTSLSMLALVFMTNISNIHADNDSLENILEVIKNNDLLDIKKIGFDKTGNVIPNSIEEVNIEERTTSLENGTYLLNRGTGWVLGGDKSFAKSGFAGPGETLSILEGKTSSYQHNIMVGAGLELDFEAVKLAVELAYEHSIRTSETIMTGFEITSPKDKSIYAKTYTTFNRFDLIKINNGNLVGHSSTYEPEGSWVKYIKYNEGDYIDQEALKERVNRCVLGEPEEINIKNSITINGVNSTGTSQLKSLDILLDFNSNTLKLANRTNTPIHSGFGAQEYFKIELVDQNNRVKSSLVMNGNDYSKDKKYDSFDNSEYKVGDEIRVYHREPNRLSINGSVIGEVQSKSIQYYEITKDGLRNNIKNSITVKGSDHLKSLDILLISNSNTFRLTDRTNTPIHPGTGSNEYFKIELLDQNNHVKSSLVMNGNDYSKNSKYDSFDNLEYKIGDEIRIYHKEPNLLNVNGSIIGEAQNKDIQYYEVTEDGLKNVEPARMDVYGLPMKAAFKLIFEENKTISFIDRVDEPIYPTIKGEQYFHIKLLDKNKNEKKSLSLNGWNHPSDPGYSFFNGTPYEVGDYVEIYTKLEIGDTIRFFGRIDGTNKSEKTQLYRITENGLIAVKKDEPVVMDVYNPSNNLAFKLGFDKDKTISFNNRIDSPIDNSIGNEKYFHIKLLDEYKNVKESLILNGSDNPSNQRFSSFNGQGYEIGDYVEIYLKDGFRDKIRFTGPISGTDTIKDKQLFEITEAGLVAVEMDDYVRIGAIMDVYNSYNNKVFNIEFLKNKTISFSGRISSPLDNSIGSEKYFHINLLDEYKNLKESLTLNGSDDPSDQKFSFFDGKKYEIGDYIEIYLKDGFRDKIKFTGSISGTDTSKDTQLYKITEDGIFAQN